ncbi:hypothetical protein PO909_009938 [Leuciscus waleckii]
MPVAMLPLHLETTLAKEGHTCKFKLHLSRFTLSDTVTNARGRLLTTAGRFERLLMEDHAYSRGHVTESPRKRKRELKRQRDRQISKTKVNTGVTFPRWKELMRSKDFKTDAEVACFLLDR